MPFGRYKGIRIRLLPDAYLSWLTTAPMMQVPEWRWLHDSLIAELKFRGLKYELADTPDPQSVDRPEKKARKFRFKTQSEASG
jgi:uncharacterized protein (DUF3820 family)